MHVIGISVFFGAFTLKKLPCNINTTSIHFSAVISADMSVEKQSHSTVITFAKKTSKPQPDAFFRWYFHIACVILVSFLNQFQCINKKKQNISMTLKTNRIHHRNHCEMAVRPLNTWKRFILLLFTAPCSADQLFNFSN